ncbi:MAG: hypothetical protein V3R98_06345 [Alphaproteobacteria bacterium]
MSGHDEAALRNHMRPRDIEVFKKAAKFYDVFILVRRTNPASLKFIGLSGYTPKRLDCKPKTADSFFTAPGQGRKDVAGLVVDPTITGPAAFNSGAKYQNAMRLWTPFAARLAPAMADPRQAEALTYLPGGKFYFVQRDPADARYGCLKFAGNSLVSAGKYIHGDYDLYGIVPADNRGDNIIVSEERLGAAHSRGRKFFDVQHFLNNGIGVPMVLHGSQEKFAPDHSDEVIDIFHPDGRTVTAAAGREAIRGEYRDRFQGRRLPPKGGLSQQQRYVGV